MARKIFFMDKDYPAGGFGGSGGGFDKTNLYTNSGTGFENTVTLSDDFDNYEYLEFVTYKSDDGTYDDALNEKFISKEILTELLNNSMTAKSDAFMLIGDPHNGAQYARYSVASKTSFSKIWTNGNWTLKEINGINLGGGGSDIVIEQYDFANFTAQGKIVLPFKVDADYKITVTFQSPTYKNDNSIIGNTKNNQLSHCTQWSNRYYVSTGNGQADFSADLTAKHTYVTNDNGHNLLDDSVVSNYTPTTASDTYLVLAGRQSADQNFQGKIYEYILESINTGDELMHLAPRKIKAKGAVLAQGLLDLISGEFYTTNGVTLGND